MTSDIDLPGMLPPLRATEFLRSMEATLPGLYVLGSLNRHITVHSQQCRAINLIQSLMQENGGLNDKSMAVVGAGFAGLTAAAFALEMTTATVSLFDTAPRPIWIQDSCANRWLHPGIYDWPQPNSLEPCTALPVLNWRAGTAGDVAAQVRTEWERLAAKQDRISSHLGIGVAAVTPAENGKLLVERSDGKRDAFDLVVLAVGFGLEGGGPGRVGYWNDADGLDGIAPDAEVLVSGFGDGGLADVLRLCLPEIRQDSLVELVRHVPIEDCKKLAKWEQDFGKNGPALDECYAKLRVKPIIQHLENSASPLARVTLAGKGHLYGPRSAVLNRFLVSQLHQARGEKAFKLVSGPVDEKSLTELADGRRRIVLGDGTAREFDRIVLRLGPTAVYPAIAPLSKWGEDRRQLWLMMPQSLDQTRVPLWKEPEPPAPKLGSRQDFLAYESSSRRWCLVLHPANPAIDWAVHTRLALDTLSDSIVGLNPAPLALCSDDALSDEAAIGGAVRALCAADVIVVDITGYDAGVLFLLGVRAAVRRGVTIACTRQASSRTLWAQMPFNLRELNILSFYNEDHGHEALKEALHAGLTQSGISPRYLDLPVYDYVREDSGDPRGDLSRVLFLRAFDSGSGKHRIVYGGGRKKLAESAIRKGLGLPKDRPIEAVIDQKSPRLAGQRLYEAIRHWQTCIVDLTWWRPNVLFELGVRLAVRPDATFCLIDESPEGDATFEGSRAKLKALLHPFSYDLETPNFAKAFATRAPTSIYQAAARHFRTRQDRAGERVDTMLLTAAAVARGADPLQAVDLKPLYARDNPEYGTELRHSAFEKLCAAWYYLAEREHPHAAKPIELLDPPRAETFRRLFTLGSRLKTVLAHRHEPRDQRLRTRIEDSEKQAEKSGAAAMDRLLYAWAQCRGRALWNIDVAKVQEADLKDGAHDLEQLKKLQDVLQGLASPVCELPLQAVRADLQRLESWRRRSGGEPDDR